MAARQLTPAASRDRHLGLGGACKPAAAGLALDGVPPRGSKALALDGAPVFLYHGLADSSHLQVPRHERKYWVPQASFRDHLSEIRRQGCRPVLLRDFWNPAPDFGAIQRERFSLAGARPRPVAVTFDDGWASDYRLAYPLLMEAGTCATFFVSTSTIGWQGHLGWPEIKEMQRAGMSFQSHSHDHVDLSRLSANALERQLRLSKCLLEDRLGCVVDFLAVPYGLLNDRLLQVAKQVGYRAVCNSRSWVARPGDRMVNRIAIDAHTTLSDFRRFLAPRPASFAARTLRSMVLYLPKRLMLRFWPGQLGVHVLEEQS